MLRFSAICFAAAFFLSSGQRLGAADRVIVEDESFVVSVGSNFQCKPTVPIQLKAPTAISFNQDNLVKNQGLIAATGAILGFECDRIQKLKITGTVGGVEIYSSAAELSSGWAATEQVYPLKDLANKVASYQPSFDTLLKAGAEFARFSGINGIDRTDQFQLFNAAGRDLVAKVFGRGIEYFDAYISDLIFQSDNAADADKEVALVTSATAVFDSETASILRERYKSRRQNLLDNVWNARLSSAINDGDSFGLAVENVNELVARTKPDDAILARIDERLSAKADEIAASRLSDLADGFLSDVGAAANALGGFENASLADWLPNTQTRVSRASESLSIETRLKLREFESAAFDVISKTGSSFQDVADVTETGIALGQEFDDAGFSEIADQIRTASADRAYQVLRDDLPVFRADLGLLEATQETVAILSDQKFIFSELSVEFPIYESYIAAVDQTLAHTRGVVCGNLSKAAVADESLLKLSIIVKSKTLPFHEFVCELYLNDHVVELFSPNAQNDGFKLDILTADQDYRSFRLRPRQKTSSPTHYLGDGIYSDNVQPIAEADWIRAIDDLIAPPPTGMPDARGVTECDLLAGDPDDQNLVGGGVDLFDPNHNIDRAIGACIAAVTHAPDDPRQNYQLWRVLDAIGDEENAPYHLDLAVEQNYAPALFAKAMIVFGSSEDDVDSFSEVMEMAQEAADMGYQPAVEFTGDFDGIGGGLFAESEPPTDSEILSTYTRRNCQAALGSQICEIVDGVAEKSCFQVSATDFSCEHRLWMKGTSGHPVMALILGLKQGGAGRFLGQTHFATFRKLEDGSWVRIPN